MLVFHYMTNYWIEFYILLGNIYIICYLNGNMNIGEGDGVSICLLLLEFMEEEILLLFGIPIRMYRL